jgi:hypothetical protein
MQIMRLKSSNKATEQFRPELFDDSVSCTLEGMVISRWQFVQGRSFRLNEILSFTLHYSINWIYTETDGGIAHLMHKSVDPKIHRPLKFSSDSMSVNLDKRPILNTFYRQKVWENKVTIPAHKQNFFNAFVSKVLLMLWREKWNMFGCIQPHKRFDPIIHRNSHTNHSKWSKQTK